MVTDQSLAIDFQALIELPVPLRWLLVSNFEFLAHAAGRTVSCDTRPEAHQLKQSFPRHDGLEWCVDAVRAWSPMPALCRCATRMGFWVDV